MHYIAGAIGLAPAVLGMAGAPATASAATANQAGPAKTVSLHHVLATTARANAAVASSSSTGQSPATTAGCTGDTPFRIHKNNLLKGHGWYKNESFLDSKTCIGTVDVWAHFNRNICKDVTLSITTAFDSWKRTHSVCGAGGHSAMTQFNVHRIFNHVGHIGGVTLCATSTYDHHGACATIGS